VARTKGKEDKITDMARLVREGAVEERLNLAGADDVQALISLGWQLNSEGAHDLADRVFTRATELSPDLAEAWLGRGVALGNLGRHEEALAGFHKASELDPNDPKAPYGKGLALAKLGRYEGALAPYDKALRLDPNNAKARYRKGLALAKLGRYEEALAALDEALKVDPNLEEAWCNKAAALGILGRYEQALAAVDKALELDPNDAKAWSNKGNALNNLGRHEDALAAHHKALELDPNDAKAWCNKGVGLGNLGRHEDALSAFDKALQVDRNLAEAWYNKGTTLHSLGRDQHALLAFDNALQLDPNNAKAWSNKGVALHNLGRYEDALAAHGKALELDRNDAKGWSNKGIALGNLGRYEEALGAHDKALQLDPNLAEAWYNKAVALHNVGGYEEALAAFHKALQLDPNLADARHNKGVTLEKLGRYEDALAASDEALELDPNDGKAWYGKGVALHNLGRYEEALAAFDRALQLDPNDAKALFNKGVALHNLGRYEEALAAYDKALELDPNLADARYNKGVALGSTHQYREAEGCFSRAASAYQERGERGNARDATRQARLARNGHQLMEMLHPVDEDFMASLKTPSLAELAHRAASCVTAINGVGRAFRRKRIPGDAGSLLRSKQACFGALLDAVSFRKLKAKALGKAKAVFKEQGLVEFVFALEDIRALGHKLEMYRPGPVERIPEKEQRALLMSLRGVQMLDGDLSREMMATFNGEPRPAEPSALKERVEIKSVYIADRQANWVRVCVVQLDFEVTRTFPYVLTDKCKRGLKKKVLDSLQTAAEEKVNVICFPELSFAGEWIEEVKLMSGDMLVVCGTYYDANRRNVCEIVIGGKSYPYAKCHPSVLEDKAPFDMVPGRTIPLFQTRFGKVLVAICRDFNDELHQISELEPDLVLSPRWDPDRDHHFQQLASIGIAKSDSSRSRTFTLFANPVEVETITRKGGGGGSCIIGSDLPYSNDFYIQNGFRPKDGVEHKLFEAKGEMMIITSLLLGDRTGERSKIGNWYRHDGTSWKKLSGEEMRIWL